MIAERLGRTVAELEATITDAELMMWFALLEVEKHEADQARRRSQSKSTRR